MLRQYELIDKVKAYDDHTDETLLNKAYVFALRAHGAQKRESGDPFFSHPVEVAGILADFKFDYLTVVAALLHDTVEDTEVSLKDIEQHFGSEVAFVVDSVTKLSRLELRSKNSQQAENFRKLVLAMAEDIRVLFVKLADRLHNMRTLYYIKDPLRRQKIAQETLDIYAPLASRVGVQKMKEQFEDLAFKELQPQDYDNLSKKLQKIVSSVEDPIANIVHDLDDLMKSSGLKARIFGRVKTPYSIWTKMKAHNLLFDQLCDILAFRVIVTTLPDCYRALGILHCAYRVIPGRFRDYISTPKSNQYQSLHTSVMSPQHQRIEVQIRTEEMDRSAEYGIAAHWTYKQGLRSYDGKRYQWIRNLLQMLQQAKNPEEFLANTKLEMYRDQVFCFTDHGDLMILPKGVTPIDFAYAIDTWQGDHVVEAKINGRDQPLWTSLKSGDQVEIITSDTQTPSAAWEDFVVTGKAHSRIRQFLRLQQQKQGIQQGQDLLQAAATRRGLSLEEPRLNAAAKHFDYDNCFELFEAISEGLVAADEVIEYLIGEQD